MPESIILQGNDNPEKSTIIKDMMERLTAESKFVLYAIFNTPGELSELFFGGITKKRTVFRHLRNKGLTLDKISQAEEDLGKLTRKTKPNEQLVRQYLKALGWENREINRTVFELREFTRDISRL